MTDIQLAAASSANTYQGNASKKYSGKPTTLIASGKTDNKRRHFLLGHPLPAIVLAPGTIIASAELILTNRTAISGNGQIIAERVVSPTWATGKVSYNISKDMVVADPITVSFTGGLAAGAQVSFNVLPHLAAWRAGAPMAGFRFRTGDNADRSFINSGPTAPVLKITYYVAPAKPGGLSPNYQAVSVVKPEVIFQDQDPNDAAQTGLVVQVNNAANDSGVLYESPVLPTTDTLVDLADLVGVPSLATYSPLFWRVKQLGIGNTESPWSDWARYTLSPLGVVTINVPAPAPNNVVTDPTPPIGWAFSGTQTAYQVIIRDAAAPAGAAPLWNTGILSGTTNTVTPPRGVITGVGGDYTVQVNVWDDVKRVVIGGIEQHATATRAFTFALSSSVAPVTDLAHVDLLPLPFSKLTWTRTEAADEYVIVRDGVIVDTIAAVDALVSGTSYEYIDQLAPPHREHTWQVWAVANGVTSSANTPVTAIVTPAGVWLSVPDADDYLTIITDKRQDVGLSEVGETLWPLNSEYGVRITSTLRGLSGSVVGELVATELTGSATGLELQDQFKASRRIHNGHRRILTLGTTAIAVLAYDMTIADTPHVGRNGDFVYACAFNFIPVP